MDMRKEPVSFQTAAPDTSVPSPMSGDAATKVKVIALHAPYIFPIRAPLRSIIPVFYSRYRIRADTKYGDEKIH